MGTAHSLFEPAVFLERAGIEDAGAELVGALELIYWRGGGPEVWEHS